MTKATPDQQRQLLDLQKTDAAIRRLEHRRANLPEQRALDEHQDTLARVTSELADAREEVASTEKRQTRLEGDVSAVESRRRSEEGRMYSGLITSEKELEAIRGELSSLKVRKNDLEEELIAAMERNEELEGMLSSLEERRGELVDLVEELTAARNEAGSGIETELAELRSTRDEQAASVPDDLLQSYEEMRARKGGVAVAELSGRTCSGCHLELTAIELEQAREDAKDSLAYCEHCERILVPID